MKSGNEIRWILQSWRKYSNPWLHDFNIARHRHTRPLCLSWTILIWSRIRPSTKNSYAFNRNHTEYSYHEFAVYDVHPNHGRLHDSIFHCHFRSWFSDLDFAQLNLCSWIGWLKLTQTKHTNWNGHVHTNRQSSQLPTHQIRSRMKFEKKKKKCQWISGSYWTLLKPILLLISSVISWKNFYPFFFVSE